MALCGDLDQPCRPGVLEERGPEIHVEELVGHPFEASSAQSPRARRGRGHSTSPEGLEDGHHYGFIVTFATPPARDASLNDSNHRPVAEAIGAAAERIVVFDI
jgi:hypothetical protein